MAVLGIGVTIPLWGPVPVGRWGGSPPRSERAPPEGPMCCVYDQCLRCGQLVPEGSLDTGWCRMCLAKLQMTGGSRYTDIVRELTEKRSSIIREVDSGLEGGDS